MKEADRNDNEKPKPEPITSGFKKLGLQWLIEHPTSHQHLWWLDSFVLRNPPLRQAPNVMGKPNRRHNKNERQK